LINDFPVDLFRLAVVVEESEEFTLRKDEGDGRSLESDVLAAS
jgi:hypothetical protein